MSTTALGGGGSGIKLGPGNSIWVSDMGGRSPVIPASLWLPRACVSRTLDWEKEPGFESRYPEKDAELLAARPDTCSKAVSSGIRSEPMVENMICVLMATSVPAIPGPFLPLQGRHPLRVTSCVCQVNPKCSYVRLVSNSDLF